MRHSPNKWPYLLPAACGLALCSTPRAQAAPVVEASVPVGQRPAGTAVNTVTNRVYVANEADDTLTVVDGTNNTVIGAAVAVGDGPRAVAVNETTNRIYVTNGLDDTVTVLDGTSNVALGLAIPVGDNPSDVDVNETTNRIYVTNEGSGTVTVIDSTTNVPIDTDGNIANGITPIAIGPANSAPNGVAVNETTNRIYVTAGSGGTSSSSGGGRLYIINGADNSVASVPVGTNAFLGATPRGVAVNETTNRVYVVGISGTNALIVFDGADNARIAALAFPTNSGTTSVDVDPDTNRIYVHNASPGNVAIVNGVNNTLITTVPLPSSRTRPTNLSVNPVTKRIYVTTTNFSSVNNFLQVISDLPDILQFGAATFTVNEGAGTAVVPVTRTGSRTGTVTVNFATADGTAVAPFDYTSTSGTLTFGDGVTTQNISVPITFNAIAEGDETFSITLSAPTNAATLGTPVTSTVTITESTVQAPTQTIFAITSSNRLFRFNSNNPGSTGPMVQVTGLQSGENLLGIDFRPANGLLYGLTSGSRLYTINTVTGAATLASTLSVPLSGTAFGVDFNPVPDRLRVVSNTEQNFRINVDTGAVIVDGPIAYATGDVNEGQNPNVVGSAYRNPDNDPGTGTELYDIDSNLDILATQNPPNAGTLLTDGPLGIDTSDIVGFDIGLDATAFAALTPAGGFSSLFTIDLDSGRANDLGQINIPDAVRGIAIALPGTITLNAAAATVAESAGSVAVTVTRTGSNAAAVTVTVANGTATAGSDFTNPSVGRITFAPDETSRTITIPILNDTISEGNETFTVTLSAPENATLTAPVAQTITITDDDAAALTLSIAPNTLSENGGTATGTLTRNTQSSAALTVALTSSDTSEITVPANVTIPAGQASVTFAVTAVDDNIQDGSQNVTVSASANGFAAVAQNVTVTDDESSQLALSIAPGTFGENASATGTVSRNTSTSGALTVNLFSSDTNQARVPASVTIPAGASSATFTVTGVNDNVVDGSQTVTIAASATGFGASQAVVTVTDNNVAVPGNNAPVANSQQLQTDNVTPLSITLTASDTDGDPLAFVVGQDIPGSTRPEDKGFGPANGTLSGTAPNLTYTARAGFVGRDAFTFYVSDGQTTSQQALIDIVVAGAAISAANDSYTLVIGSSEQKQGAGITALSNNIFRIAAPGVLANDRDPSNGKLTARLALNPRNGRILVRADGGFDYQPNAGFAGTDEFAYTVTNGTTSSNARVRLIVNDRNAPELRFDAPVNGALLKEVTVIRGRVRDRNAGLKSLTLLWRRFDGAFWNGSQWVAAATELPLTVQGINWKYTGNLPEPGTDRTTDLLDGRYDLRVTAMDKSNNTSRITNRITVRNETPTPAPDFSTVRLSSAGASAAQNAIVLRFTGALDADVASETMN